MLVSPFVQSLLIVKAFLKALDVTVIVSSCISSVLRWSVALSYTGFVDNYQFSWTPWSSLQGWYKSFGWVCWSCCLEFHLVFCASFTLSFQYAGEFSWLVIMLNWNAPLKISANAFLLIGKNPHNCVVSNVFCVHRGILLAHLHIDNTPCFLMLLKGAAWKD